MSQENAKLLGWSIGLFFVSFGTFLTFGIGPALIVFGVCFIIPAYR